MGRVDGKACVVTGAGSGIAKAIAERLAEDGGNVLCVDVNGATVSERRRAFGKRAGLLTQSQQMSAIATKSMRS